MIRLKAWYKATHIRKATPQEVDYLKQVEETYPKASYLAYRDSQYKARHWESLEQYLFGGMISVGCGIDPTKALDTVTNPPLQVHVPGFVITHDEHDEEEPIKPLPDKEYLRLLAQTWVYEPLLFIPKSRQLMVTWIFCAIASHELLARRMRRIAFITKKFDDAKGLLDRIKSICDHWPSDTGFYSPFIKDTQGYLTSETGSVIHAIGESSPKALRGYTFSWIFSDETAFQEDASEQYRAALASVKGTGKVSMSRYTAVSTSNGKGFFFNILSDEGKIPCPPGK